MPRRSKGRLIVISAPSGAGKTTLAAALVEVDPAFVFSISYTTRKPRPTEVDGKDYIFVSEPEFRRLEADNEMLESARVFDNCYGTSRSQVAEHLSAGRHVILEIDWQGARQVRAAMPECVSIFVLPPSIASLRSRLENRQTDTPDVIERRLRDSLDDLSHWTEFDYFVVNDRLDDAVQELEGIALGRMRRNRTATARAGATVKAILSDRSR